MSARKKNQEEHILKRADYYHGLIVKTIDPVYRDEPILKEAKLILSAARELGHRRYETALFMAEVALHKASFARS